MIIQDVFINYEDFGNKKEDPIVFLHGWGQNIDMMKPLAELFLSNSRIIIIDLPGHGKSEEPKKVWTVKDYMEAIKELLDKIEAKKPILIGHSFGGKISLLYASKYDVNKLIVLGSPYKKGVEKLSFKVKILKTLKKIPVVNKLEEFAKQRIGSNDYKNASPMMRKILVETVNLDISEELSKITAPTLIIWGTEDEAVPYNDAILLEKMISNAGLVTIEGATHYAYLEHLQYVGNVIKVLLKDCSNRSDKI